MKETNMRECLVCGKLFKPCDYCKKYSLTLSNENYQWRKVVCCPEHFHYHLPIIQYVNKIITLKEAYEQLTEAIETYGEITFSENIKAVADEILSYSDKKSVSEETIEKPQAKRNKK